MTGAPSPDDWSDWVGKVQETEDRITAFPVKAMAATLDRTAIAADGPETGAALPAGWHWMYFAELAPLSDLGPDGHPARGGFLPPIPLPRRMWGGSSLVMHQPLRVGETARRRTEILSVALKQGRTGALAFVVLQHRFSGENGLALEERQTVVYRDLSTDKAAPPPGAPPPDDGVWHRELVPDPVLLFRYSALTFNSHRIHYDAPYVTEVEGYPGLIVHGPLTATLLLDLIHRERPDAPLASATIRARRPLFADQPLVLAGKPTETGCHVWALDPAGASAMTIEAVFS